MKTAITSGLTLTALVTTLGSSLFLLDNPEKTWASSADVASAVSEVQPLSQESAIPSSAISTNNQNGMVRPEIAPTFLTPQSAAPIATTVPYATKDGRLAVTVRFKSLPIVTLLGTTEELKSFSPQNVTDKGVQSQAKAIADKLNQFAQAQDFDATSITLTQDKRQQTYSIQVAGEELIRLDRNTVLPGQARLSSQTALQITNNLRRLMGNAAPLKTLATASLSPGNGALSQPNVGIQETTVRQRVRSGIASWYGPGFHGRRTANGERYNQNSLTAAHKTLPFGTQVLVTNLHTGRSVMVRINDRGPFIRGRVIDLSAGAAKVIGVYGRGTAPVALEIVK
ncbi:MAG: septal ring lytic transglycosylase RlpA family protein, partial [Microcystaceae cyanobacterium]